jgi:hypothetical protein
MIIITPYESALALLAVVACAALAGCRPSGAEWPLIVVVSGDTNGWIVPCGCTSNQSGGLPRRATLIKGLRRRAEVVAIDVGGAVHGTSPYDLAKFKAILSGEMEMKIAANNIGAAEARFGPGELRRLAKQMNVPLLSANVRDAAGTLVAEPVRLISAAGRRLALVGVLAERYATAEVQVTPPREAVVEALAGVAGKYDTAIVLAYLPEDELRQLAEALPEADVIVGGPTGQPIAPRQIGPTLLTSATNKGKFVARLDAPPLRSAEGWKGSIVELSDRYADDPAQQDGVARFRFELHRSDFAPGQTSFADPLPANLPKGYAVAGTAACKKCHEDDCRQWRESKHATAWKALKTTGSYVDPECQRCHTTGYGLPDGFASIRDDASPHDRVNVGCEDCHGPSRAHVADSALHTPRFARAKDCCTACHDRENSPKFDYDKYWEKVHHGQKAKENVP